MRRWMCLLTAAGVLLSSPAVGEPLPAAKWLVDLGRDYPLSPQAGLSDADAEVTLLFMQAANQIDRGLAEAYLWRYDMLIALGRDLEAHKTLGQYVRLDPTDMPAHLNWLALTIESLQTAEKRAEFCRAYLRRPGLPKELSSDLHRRLADFHLNRGETTQAKAEADAALADYKFNFAARTLRDELRGTAQPATGPAAATRPAHSTPPVAAVRQVELLLAAMKMNPGNADAAWQLANQLRSLGMVPEADRWYNHAAAVYALLPSGTPPALLEDRQAQVLTTRPAPAEITSVLKRFPSQVLDYPLNPGKYLNLSLRMPGDELPPGEPWRCTVRLENTGEFPITLGQSMMVVPDVLCEVTTRGDRVRTSGPTIRIPLNRQLRLMPGESIVLVQTLDVGPIRSSMIGTPQITHEVEVAAVLSPISWMSEDGRETWTPGIGGLMADPLQFRRSAFVPTPEALGSLINQSRSGDISARIAAVELLAMLLAEHQHLAARRLQYRIRPVSINATTVQAAVLARAGDPDWQVRARLAECMRWFVLDKSANKVAGRLLQDPHWLVRGLTLRMLADQHQAKVRNVLESYARTDPAKWVRRLSTALLARMPQSTQPADSG